MMVHSLDMMSWAMNGKMPLKAVGVGGRQSRVEEIYGNVYDHFALEYQYENGVRGFHMSRQQEGASSTNKVEIFGTQGKAFIDGGKHEITGKNKWIYQGEKNDMYQTQHNELFASIRKGNPINDGERMANSTLLGIWGRMAGYSGQTITMDEAYNSNLVLGPAIEQYSLNLNWPGMEVAKPGVTRHI
jgi:predicted dehydrogenase